MYRWLVASAVLAGSLALGSTALADHGHRRRVHHHHHIPPRANCYPYGGHRHHYPSYSVYRGYYSSPYDHHYRYRSRYYGGSGVSVYSPRVGFSIRF